VMGISMFIQQKLNPPPPDPMQAKIMLPWSILIFNLSDNVCIQFVYAVPLIQFKIICNFLKIQYFIALTIKEKNVRNQNLTLVKLKVQNGIFSTFVQLVGEKIKQKCITLRATKFVLIKVHD
jgi:hypothetical protein